MRVFVAGASGAIGRRLVPSLVEAGHDVTGMTRSADKPEALRAAGAEPVVCDALDAEAVRAAVARAKPEVVVHQLTAIPPAFNPRRMAYGFSCGPGPAYAPEGAIAEQVRRRRFPVGGRGTGRFSFVHLDDAARATIAAVEGGPPGAYNIVDDEPAPVSEWLPAYAAALGAPAPRRMPGWLVRLAAGRYAQYTMTELRGASNARARERLGWAPQLSSWRQGFGNGLG